MTKKQFPYITEALAKAANADAETRQRSRRIVDKSSQNRETSLADTLGDITGALSSYPNTRSSFGVTNRNEQVISWRIPNGSVIQMYINPENLTVNESKQITTTRTKGGYALQYWGENLTKITLQGTTGSSGVKGINVLRDIYRSEMRAFDIVANTQIEQMQKSLDAMSLENSSFGSVFNDMSEDMRKRNFLLRPTLASLAAGVLMFYQGVQYRGFFSSFQVIESVEKLGLFTYTIEFNATSISGRRQNFLAWHREVTDDDLGAQLLSSIGNTIRGAVGLGPASPNVRHPGNSQLTFNEGKTFII